MLQIKAFYVLTVKKLFWQIVRMARLAQQGCCKDLRPAVESSEPRWG